MVLSLSIFVSAQNTIILSDSNASSEIAVANSISENWVELNFTILKLSETTKSEILDSQITIFLYKNMGVIILDNAGQGGFDNAINISSYLKQKKYLVNSISAPSLCPPPKIGEWVGEDDCTLTPFVLSEDISSFSTDIPGELYGALKLVYPNYDSAQIFLNQDTNSGLISINGEWNPIILKEKSAELNWNSIVSISQENYKPGDGANVGYPTEEDSLFHISKISLIQEVNSTENLIVEEEVNLPAKSSTKYKIPSNSQLGDNFYLRLDLSQYSINPNGTIFSQKIASDRIGPFSIYAGPLTCKDYGSYAISEDKIGGIKIEKTDKCISHNALLDAYCTKDNRTAYRDVDCLSCVKDTCIVGEQTQINEPSQESNETESSVVQINPNSNECENVGLVHNKKYCSIEKTWVDQKEADSFCENNFECSTNLCIDNKCISSGLWEKILNFFKSLFG